jgi:hypothetical protein
MSRESQRQQGADAPVELNPPWNRCAEFRVLGVEQILADERDLERRGRPPADADRLAAVTARARRRRSRGWLIRAA